MSLNQVSGFPSISPSDGHIPIEPSTSPISLPQDEESTVQVYTSGKRKGRPKPCDSCRMRRIRCDRPPPPTPLGPCVRCSEKGIKCTTVRETNPGRKVNRDGQVIQMAMNMFGQTQERSLEDSIRLPVASGNTPPHRKRRRSNDELAVEVEDRSIVPYHSSRLISPTSLPNRLHDTELLSSLTLELMDQFFRFGMGKNTFVRWDEFRQRFDAAGRRPEQMGKKEAVLCALLVAMGSRATDCPLVVPSKPLRRLGSKQRRLATTGSKEPLEQEPRRTSEDNEVLEEEELSLDDEGKQRSGVFALLRERAMRMSEETNILETPSLPSVAVMALSVLVLSVPPGTQTCETENHIKIRIHLRIMAEHLKILYEQRAPESDCMYDTLVWTAFCHDAMATAKMGVPPSYSEDDFQTMCQPNGISLSDGLHFLKSRTPYSPGIDNHEHIFWTAICPILEETCRISQMLFRLITGSKARQRPLSEEELQNLLSRLRFFKLCIPQILPNMRRVLPSHLITDFPCNAAWFERFFRIAWADFVLVIKNTLAQRKAEGLEWEWDFPATAGELPHLRTEALLREVDSMAFEAGRTIASVLHDYRDVGRMMGSISGIPQVLRHLPQAAFELITCPPSDSSRTSNFDHFDPGAKSDWTSDQKVEELSWMIEAITQLCCSFDLEYLKQVRAWLQSERDELVIMNAFNSASPSDGSEGSQSGSSKDDQTNRTVRSLTPPPQTLHASFHVLGNLSFSDPWRPELGN